MISVFSFEFNGFQMKIAADELIKFANDLASNESINVDEMKRKFLDTTEAMLRKDIEDNKAIGTNGANAILQNTDEKGVKILTHCNTGSLATAGYGTALGVVRTLFEMNRLEHIYCTETRPYNQGARLTAFELVHDKLPATLIIDSMVAALMQKKVIHCDDISSENCRSLNKNFTNFHSTSHKIEYHGCGCWCGSGRSQW